MKMRNDFIICLFILPFLSGCIKTGTKEIIMPDQEIIGNQGYLKGQPPVVKERQVKKKIIDIEVEIPPLFEKAKTSFTEDKDIWGNQGYVYKKEESMKYYYIEPRKPVIEVPRAKKVEEPETEFVPEMEIPAPKVEYIEYKVREGESLWSIAKKVYGDATKWTLIYENNKDKIKEPHLLKPGMVLKIPIFEEALYIK